MARKTPSRLELRRQAEAVEGQEASTEATAKPAKKARKKAPARSKRTKEKVSVRKRIVWVIYNGSMKEEGRFPYDQRDQAEEKAEQLRSKSKKLYFIQPLKEAIGESPAAPTPAQAKVSKPAAKKRRPVEDDDDRDDDDVEMSDDDEDAGDEEPDDSEE